MTIALPEDVSRILKIIQSAGYEAYAVGGCVRDSLLGRKPDDWDITTSALPGEIKVLFPKTIDTGIKHGTVTVMMNRVGYEVTTYRIDGEYEDGRHPKKVTFTPSLIEDLKRRDFTINAMAYNEEMGLVDVFNGTEDMEKKIIRCVGDARCRFEEDALRMMRAVRFSAQLGYKIEESTAEAIKEMASTLAKISAERIQVELVKLLVSAHPDYLRTAWENGLTEIFLPEFNHAMETEQNHPHHCFSVGEHILHALTYSPPDRVLRLALLMHDLGKPVVQTRDEKGTDHFYGHGAVGEEMAGQILKRLRFDNHTTEKVCRLVKYHDLRIEPSPKSVRKAMIKIGPEQFSTFLELQRADVLAQSEEKREEKLDTLARLKQVYQQILLEKNCLSLKELAVSGKDLMELGMKPGKELGEYLNRLLEHVIDQPQDNQRDVLLKLAVNWQVK
ncbi:MAG: CCA tRNA nucleotidyltransferase [Lachnospiraceae bacterium]